MTTQLMTIDELRTLLAGVRDDRLRDVLSPDDAVLDLYAWQEAELMADGFIDDSDGLADLLADYMRGRAVPVEMEQVVEWLREYQDPDAMGGTREELEALIAEFKSTRQPSSTSEE